MPQLERDYISTGKVKYVLLDFPIAGLHPLAFKAHEAARCAGDQNQYWEMHARIFANQQAMSPTDLEAHAKALGLDLAKFQQCLRSEAHAADVRRDLAEGHKAGVSGTPMFFLGITDLNAPRFKASRVLTGAQPYGRFKEAIEALLKQPSSKQPQ